MRTVLLLLIWNMRGTLLIQHKKQNRIYIEYSQEHGYHCFTLCRTCWRGGENNICIKHFTSQQLNSKSNALLAVHFNQTFTCSTDESESCACKERDRDLKRIYLHPSPATEDAMTSIHNISDFPAAAAITRARHQRFLSELEANHTNTHEPGAKNTDLDPTEALV